MSKLNSLKDLLINEIGDLLSAENQLVAAMPNIAEASTSPELRAAFEKHLAETNQHVTRIKQAFELIEQPVKAKTCAATKGLIEEAMEMIGEEGNPAVVDGGIIACVQRIEHYEIAAYGCACTFAKLLGLTEVEALLHKTLNEESEMNQELTKLAETVNRKALSEGLSSEVGARS